MSSSPVPNQMAEMLALISPIVTAFNGYSDGKIGRTEAINIFYDFMQKTIPVPMRPSRDLAISLLKSPMTGFANLPQIMAAMIVVLQDQ